MSRECEPKPPDREEPVPIRDRRVVVLPVVFEENPEAVADIRMMLEGLRTRDVQ